MKKPKNIVHKYPSVILTLVILAVWESLFQMGFIPNYLLPGVSQIILAFIKDLPTLLYHTQFTLIEAILGMSLSLVLGLTFGILMDKFPLCHRALHPILALSQTIPVIALAPLMIIWFGYGLSSKVLVVTLLCFFPITLSFFSGLNQVEKGYLDLFRSFHATYLQTLLHLKIPMALPSLFAGIKISASYAIVGATVAEWLGGNHGLGVYMTRVRKNFQYDKMFASIFLVSAISLILLAIIRRIEKQLKI